MTATVFSQAMVMVMVMVAPASVTFVNPIGFSLKSHTDKLR